MVHRRRPHGTAHRPTRAPNGLARDGQKFPSSHPTRPPTANGERPDLLSVWAKPRRHQPADNVTLDPKPTARRSPATCESGSGAARPTPTLPPWADRTSAGDPGRPKNVVLRSLDELPAERTSQHHSQVPYLTTRPMSRGASLPPEGSGPTLDNLSRPTQPADPRDAEFAPKAALARRLTPLPSHLPSPIRTGQPESHQMGYVRTAMNGSAVYKIVYDWAREIFSRRADG
jgi:hypothetical protein